VSHREEIDSADNWVCLGLTFAPAANAAPVPQEQGSELRL